MDRQHALELERQRAEAAALEEERQRAIAGAQEYERQRAATAAALVEQSQRDERERAAANARAQEQQLTDAAALQEDRHGVDENRDESRNSSPVSLITTTSINSVTGTISTVPTDSSEFAGPSNVNGVVASHAPDDNPLSSHLRLVQPAPQTASSTTPPDDTPSSYGHLVVQPVPHTASSTTVPDDPHQPTPEFPRQNLRRSFDGFTGFDSPVSETGSIHADDASQRLTAAGHLLYFHASPATSALPVDLTPHRAGVKMYFFYLLCWFILSRLHVYVAGGVYLPK